MNSRALVVKGEKVEPERAGIVHLVFGVVVLDAQRAGPLAKIDGHSSANRRDVRPIGLKYVAVNVRTRLVGGISLKRLGGLPELEIQPRSPTFVIGHIGRVFKHNVALVQAEGITANVIGAQEVGPANRGVEIVRVISVKEEIQRRAVQSIGYLLALRRRCWGLVVGAGVVNAAVLCA